MKATVYCYPYFGRPYVYGEAPGPKGGEALAGARSRLAKLIGGSDEELAELFTWKNLLDHWPGYGPGGGSAFPMEAAKRQARWELIYHRPLTTTLNRPFIYLGRRVAAAFNYSGEWFVWDHDQVVVPHPSGLSRWWNEPDNVELTRLFWSQQVERALQS